MVVKNESTMEKNQSISIEKSCVEELMRLLGEMLPLFPSAYIRRRWELFGQDFTFMRGPNDMQAVPDQVESDKTRRQRAHGQLIA